LSEKEIYVEGWGGDIPCVPISATKGTGVSELLDMVMLVAEIGDFKTDPKTSAEGIVIESERSARAGISATLLIKNGTLSTGSFVVAGGAFAPVRFIEDFKGKKIPEATAGMPVVVTGWSAIPECGSPFKIIGSKKEAEKVTDEYKAAKRASIKIAEDSMKATIKTPEKTADGKDIEEEEKKIVTFPIIIKADVIGSLDGIKHELAKITHDRVRLKIVSEGLGEINENDVKVAIGDPNVVIIGFNAAPDKKAAAMIERAAIPINMKNFSIIYELIQYIQDAFTAKVPKEYMEEVLGKAKILAIFSKEKDRQVIGGKVQEGVLASGAAVKIMRRDAEIGRGKIRELQSKKQRVDEVATGYECGMMVEAKVEIAVGDKIEAVRTVEKLNS
jgi:translation initiation factor IF-2